MERRMLWKVAPALSGVVIVLGMAGGMVMYLRHRARRNSIMRSAVGWPGGKNFGNFPPDLPDTMFDEVNFV